MLSTKQYQKNIVSAADLTMEFTSRLRACSMFVRWVCWYDLMAVTTSYSTASLAITAEDAASCTVNATLLSPLACDFVLNATRWSI